MQITTKLATSHKRTPIIMPPIPSVGPINSPIHFQLKNFCLLKLIMESNLGFSGMKEMPLYKKAAIKIKKMNAETTNAVMYDEYGITRGVKEIMAKEMTKTREYINAAPITCTIDID